jgi:N-acetyl-anhydromuramyl-L-alanine amidase AmpD
MLASAFVQAKKYRRGRKSAVNTLVVHVTAGREADRQSRNTAAWFADPRAGGSTHYAVDPVLITQCVLEEDTCFGAGGVNDRGIHVELCGSADQTPAEWADEASTAELQLAARLFAELCFRYDIPPQRLTLDELKAEQPGITCHADACAVYGGTHYDPGPHFPWDLFLDAVRAELAVLSAVSLPFADRPTTPGADS